MVRIGIPIKSLVTTTFTLEQGCILAFFFLNLSLESNLSKLYWKFLQENVKKIGQIEG